MIEELLLLGSLLIGGTSTVSYTSGIQPQAVT